LAENFEKDSFHSVRIRYNKVQAGELGGQHANESRAGLRGRGRTLDTARTEYCLRLVVDGGYQPARRHQPPPSQPRRAISSRTDRRRSNHRRSSRRLDQRRRVGYGSEQPCTRAAAVGGLRLRSSPRPAQPPANDSVTTRPAQNYAPTAGTGTSGAAVDLRLREQRHSGRRSVLHKETTPPEGTAVDPGRHRGRDHLAGDGLDRARSPQGAGMRLHQQRYVPQAERRGAADSQRRHFAYHYVVPADLPAGSTICDQGFVSGPQRRGGVRREISKPRLFSRLGRHGPAPPVETTTTRPRRPNCRTAEQRSDSTRQCRRRPRSPPAPLVLPRQVLAPYGWRLQPGPAGRGALSWPSWAAPVPGAGPDPPVIDSLSNDVAPAVDQRAAGLAPDRDSSARYGGRHGRRRLRQPVGRLGAVGRRGPSSLPGTGRRVSTSGDPERVADAVTEPPTSLPWPW